MKHCLIKLIGVLVYGLVFGTYPATASESPTAVTIEQTVHFTSPEGNDVAVEPGTYEVERHEEELQLVSKEGQTPIHIHAQPTPFPDEVESTIAMSIPIPDEGIYLALVRTQLNKDPRSKTAGYSGEDMNSQIPLSPFSKGGNLNGNPVASYGE